MNKNLPYPQEGPQRGPKVVGFDEQGRRRIRMRVPKRVHHYVNSSNTFSSTSFPYKEMELSIESSHANPLALPPQPTNSNISDQSYTTGSYSTYSTEQTNILNTEEKNSLPTTGVTYQTRATSVSETVPSYSTFSYYSDTNSDSYQSQTGNTQTTAISGPNSYTRLRVKVKKNKDGTKTIIGPAKGGVAKPSYAKEDPHYRAPELPPRTENERHVRGLTSISQEEEVRDSNLFDLDLKINNAVPYQDEINRHFFNAVSKKQPKIGDVENDNALPENFRVNIPYNSRFMDAQDTTMIESTTLDSMTLESSTADSFRTVVSRDLPSYWDPNKDVNPAKPKLFIQDEANYIDNEEIEKYREEEERKRLQDEADKIAVREVAEATERRRKFDEEEEEGTPWHDLFKEKPWKFIPRTKRMHIAPFDSIDESTAPYTFNSQKPVQIDGLNEYGIYIPSEHPSYPPATAQSIDIPPVSEPHDPNPATVSLESNDSNEMLTPPQQTYEIPVYNPYQYSQIQPVMPQVQIPPPYQRDNDSSQFYHLPQNQSQNETLNKHSSSRPSNQQFNQDLTHPVSANQLKKTERQSTKQTPSQQKAPEQIYPEPMDQPLKQSATSKRQTIPSGKPSNSMNIQQKTTAPNQTNGKKTPYSGYYYEEEEEEEEEEEDQIEIQYSDSEDKPKPKKQPKIIEKYDEEEEEEEEEVVEDVQIIED